MFEKIKLFVLKHAYNYHHRKANKYFDQINVGYASERNGQMWDRYLYHTNHEMVLVDEIYQIEGI